MALILNLGCGSKASDDPDVVNVDWSPYLRVARSRVLRGPAAALLDSGRAQRLAQIPQNVRVHNLQKGIPWPDRSVDSAYHSHLLEHIDRDAAPVFLREVRRVLRPGGIHRIVVPDLEALCRQLLDDLQRPDRAIDSPAHDGYVNALLEQCVRRESYGTSCQRPLRRAIENALLGDARQRGETHQWMYDRANLQELLEECGFSSVTVLDYLSSDIPNWDRYALDVNSDGSQYKPGSLYVEARRPLNSL